MYIYIYIYIYIYLCILKSTFHWLCNKFKMNFLAYFVTEICHFLYKKKLVTFNNHNKLFEY